MRMSCNGCRVLRKGCGDECSIRPCLDWIQTPDSQGHATVFLAKFYGRAGLINLLNAGSQQLRPAIFKSLLYEACGRIVNPIHGSVGLLYSGRWQLCQDAVDAVLRGDPITQDASESSNDEGHHLTKAYDIRHVYKDRDNIARGSNDPLRFRNRRRFKRAGPKAAKKRAREDVSKIKKRCPSHESSLSHQSDQMNVVDNEGEVELDLRLGFEPFKGYTKPKELVTPNHDIGEAAGAGAGLGLCKMELGLA